MTENNKRGVPVKALSIRQPWAWLIANGHKDIENRSWPTAYRGKFLIHAAKGMTRNEYEDGAEFAAQIGIIVPPFEYLERGGIVGCATLTGCVEESPSLWFLGRYGFVLKDAAALPFQPMRGRLGFFDLP